MWSANSFRLKIIIVAFLVIYGLILGAAFYYQIIGDQSLRFYTRPDTSLEIILLALIRDETRGLLAKIVAFGTVASVLLLQLSFIKHVLRSRTSKDHLDD